jgi:hypothetical protein
MPIKQLLSGIQSIAKQGGVNSIPSIRMKADRPRTSGISAKLHHDLTWKAYYYKTAVAANEKISGGKIQSRNILIQQGS